jgi:4-aminobutyrate aminotransferase / (S)-3-amino-2-methylpropionate transaminase
MSALRTLSWRSASSSARLISSRIAPVSYLCGRSFSVSARNMGRFDGVEPSGPSVKTAIPGPKSKEQIADLDKVFDTRSLNMLTDYKASIGNYIADPDGNMLLDV